MTSDDVFDQFLRLTEQSLLPSGLNSFPMTSDDFLDQFLRLTENSSYDLDSFASDNTEFAHSSYRTETSLPRPPPPPESSSPPAISRSSSPPVISSSPPTIDHDLPAFVTAPFAQITVPFAQTRGREKLIRGEVDPRNIVSGVRTRVKRTRSEDNDINGTDISTRRAKSLR